MSKIRFRLKTFFLLFILLLLPLLNFSVFFNYSSYQKDEDIDNYLDFESLKTADSWSEPFIHITGANWTITNNSKVWCSGAGTWNDPYVIENVSITADKDSIAILIEDSEEYFTLRNCTVKTNLTTMYSTGPYAIHLINTNNSQITENNLSQNYAGVKLENSHNNTIGENIINTNNTFINHGHLMFLKDSDNNLIINNIVINSNNAGIVLWEDCDNNTILENIINNTGTGIKIEGRPGELCEDNTVQANQLYNNGIRLIYYIDNCTVFNNTINNKGGYGIEIEHSSVITNSNFSNNVLKNCGFYSPNAIDSSNIIDKTNLVNNKFFYYVRNQEYLNNNNFTDAAQIALENCNHSIISDFDLSSSTMGIFLYSCNNISIINNTINNNIYPILVKYSNLNLLFRNNISNGGQGIYFEVSNNYNNISENRIINNNEGGISIRGDNNIITDNILDGNNGVAINVYYCENLQILRNNITNISDYGIRLNDQCQNISIIGNRIENCQTGIIFEDDCNFNNISLNYIFNNSDYGIIIEYSSDNNNITANIVDNNRIGIYLDSSDYNTVSNNNLSANIESGIKIGNSASFDNIIKNNLLYGCGFQLSGYLNLITSDAIDTSNRVNNKPVYIYANQLYLDSSDFINAGQVFLINCNNSIISNLDLSNGTTGLYLHSSFNNTIENINATYNKVYGIYALYSNNNTFLRNDCSFSYYDGIGVRDSSSNNITLNTLNNCSRGILISWNSEYNIISDNLICNNSNSGIYLDETWNNSIKNNAIKDNIYGVYFFKEVESNNFTENLINNNTYGVLINSYSPFNKYNLFYNNSFTNPSGINAEDNGNLNIWDNGVIGNFWHDYAGVDGNGNGIGDTPHNIYGSSNCKDNFPLMEWPFELIISNPGPFSLSSPDAGIPDDDGQFTLDWTLSSGAVNYTLYISLNIPYTTFDGSQTILVNEENVNTFLVSLSQNGTYYFRVCARNSAGEEYSDLGPIAIIVQIEQEPKNGDGGIDPGIPGYNIFLLIGIIFLGITFFKNRIQHCRT